MYSREDFEDFMKGMQKAAGLVRAFNPSIYMVSLNGGQPLFDVLTIADRNVDPSLAVYFPISSKIMDSGKVAERCFTNLLLERQHQGSEPQRILSLDEVVSGGSVSKILNAYDTALRIVGKHNVGKHDRPAITKEVEHLAGQFPLRIIGIKEARVRTRKKYEEEVRKGRIEEIPVKKILTMDDPDMHIAVFDHPTSNGWNGQGYFPTVGDIRITPKYQAFLGDTARYFGVDPVDVSPQGIGRISEHTRKYSEKSNFEH
ncbi:hypothetical protein J4422_01390 [Candidatus Pacearchaeota archaeon]|nr:hypothetical protein [Candidatus Pacearchaeota archaeon]